MQGRLYPESSSIYQDEAKILYDYFSKAADKIIEEEDKVTSEKHKLSDELESQKKGKNSFIIKWFFIIFLSLAMIILLRVVFANMSELLSFFYIFLPVSIIYMIFGVREKDKRIVEKENELKAKEEEFDKIRRDYSVGKLGVSYVPVARSVPVGDESIVVDLSGNVKSEEFKLHEFEDEAKFHSDTDKLRAVMASVPYVDSRNEDEQIDTSGDSLSMQEIPAYDYLSKLRNGMNELEKDLEKIEEISVSLPLITPESPDMEFIRTCGTTSPDDYPVINVFDEEKIDKSIKVFEHLYQERKEDKMTGSEKSLSSFIDLMADGIEMLSKEKMYSSSALLEYNGNILSNVLKSPYRCYSPRLEEEELSSLREMNFNFADMADSFSPFHFKESSTMKFDLFSDTWVDETGWHTAYPFQMGEIQEEIFMPIVDALMKDNASERRKLYEKVESEKLSYLNKWQTETQDFYGRNRDTSDTLKANILENLAKYNSAYSNWKGIKDTIERMEKQEGSDLESGKVEQAEGTGAAILVSKDVFNKKFSDQEADFDGYMERLVEDIEEKASEFAHVKYFEAYLYADDAHKSAVALSEIPVLMKDNPSLAKISPYVAKYGDMPPHPDVSQEAMSLLSCNMKKSLEQKEEGDNV